MLKMQFSAKSLTHLGGKQRPPPPPPKNPSCKTRVLRTLVTKRALRARKAFGAQPH